MIIKSLKFCYLLFLTIFSMKELVTLLLLVTLSFLLFRYFFLVYSSHILYQNGAESSL